MVLLVIKKSIISFKNIIFQHIGSKISPGSLKLFIDISFAFFEKIAYKFEKISSVYLEIYDEMVRKELNMIKINNKNNILVIGSGTLPATPILVAHKTKAKITAIDIDEKAVKKSTEYIKNLNLQDKINVRLGDGVTYPLKDFDTIFILYGIRKKREMISHLSKNVEKSTKIILRTILKDGKAKIDDTYIDLSEYFKIKDSAQSHSFGIVDSILLEKK
jgi:precorrin-6B methylase 2